MKSVIITVLFACLSAVLFSCQKELVDPTVSVTTAPAKDIISPVSNPDPVLGHISTTVKLTGNWTLVNDSTYSTGSGNSGTGTNYVGQPGDSFNFTEDGKLFIKEGTNIDTATYTVASDKKIILNYLFYAGSPVNAYGSVVASFDQVRLTGKNLTLSSSVLTPSGSYFRVINFKR